jgi:hypothetical protein
MESMRAVGYNLQTAVADIIDNSVSAEARNVDIYFNSATPDHLAIVDDGTGMSAKAAEHAMRLAGHSSDAPREKADLGRFGLGLKTASLSQCRTLTVASLRDGEVCAYRWSLDHLLKAGRWALIELSAKEIEELPRAKEFLSNKHGTMVLWQDLDYLVEERGLSQVALDEALVATRDHLALVFHRYLDGEHGKPFSIRINGKAPDKVDPFLKSHRGTQRGPKESFDVDRHRVEANPYTLPFLNKLSESDRKRAGITTTLRESQGFYIYRQMRLVIWGTWFGILPKEGMGRLARVQVDVPNTLDHLWALDIKKSAAVPPPAVKTQLKRIADRILEPSRNAFQYRGRAETDTKTVRVWTRVEDRDGFRYEINRRHPLIKAIGEQLGGSAEEALGRVLQLIEDSFPIYDACNRLNRDNTPANQEVDEQQVSALARQLWQFQQSDGVEPDAFVSAFQCTEPFCRAENPAETLRRATAND